MSLATTLHSIEMFGILLALKPHTKIKQRRDQNTGKNTEADQDSRAALCLMSFVERVWL